MIFLSISCGAPEKINFDPEFKIGDYQNNQIISRHGEVISCTEPKFNEYGCMSAEKIKELADILKSATIPRVYEKTRRRILNSLNETLLKIGEPK